MKRSLITILSITTIFTVTGCRQKNVVRQKDEAIATTQANAVKNPTQTKAVVTNGNGGNNATRTLIDITKAQEKVTQSNNTENGNATKTETKAINEQTRATQNTTANNATKPAVTKPIEVEKITVNQDVDVFATSQDALDNTNPVSKYKAGEYYVQKEENGAINISTNKDSLGGWINPLNNVNIAADSTGQDRKYVNFVTSVDVYESSDDAKAKQNIVTVWPAGKYMVYQEHNGMVNITNDPNSPGAWINPGSGYKTGMPEIKVTTVATTIPQKKITLDKATDVYGSAQDAKEGKNKLKQYDRGEYFIYKEEDSMLNISKKQGEAGAWYNPNPVVVTTTVETTSTTVEPKTTTKEKTTTTVEPKTTTKEKTTTTEEETTTKEKTTTTEEETTTTREKTTTTEEATTTQETTTTTLEPTTTTKEIKAEVIKKVVIDDYVNVYETAEDAINKENPVKTYEPGEYFVYKIEGDAYNISSADGQAGGWVNKVVAKAVENSTTTTKPVTKPTTKPATKPINDTKTTTKPIDINIASLKVGQSIPISEKIEVYANAEDAMNKVNPVKTYDANNYFIYKIEGNAINISTVNGQAGGWISKDTLNISTTQNNTTTSTNASPNTKVELTGQSKPGDIIVLTGDTLVYTTADDAKNNTNSAKKYAAGQYYIFKVSDGIYNISKVSGEAGAWINPKDKTVEEKRADLFTLKEYKGENYTVGVPSTWSNAAEEETRVSFNQKNFNIFIDTIEGDKAAKDVIKDITGKSGQDVKAIKGTISVANLSTEQTKYIAYQLKGKTIVITINELGTLNNNNKKEIEAFTSSIKFQ